MSREIFPLRFEYETAAKGDFVPRAAPPVVHATDPNPIRVVLGLLGWSPDEVDVILAGPQSPTEPAEADSSTAVPDSSQGQSAPPEPTSDANQGVPAKP